MANELILIVEDKETNRKLLRDVLQFKGYRTIEAEMGEDGVTLAMQHKPDLILMDYKLPGIDGIEAFHRIRNASATAHIPIVAVTASAMPEEAKKMKEAGFDGFLTKPINVKSFIETVERFIGKPQGK
ncbi:MAG: response regulator [Deltaproteobacteria bacterium]|nr:MAG: response regulator [Deltaproteobacteria bacterium]